MTCRELFVIYFLQNGVWQVAFSVYILQNLSTNLILQPLQHEHIFTNDNILCIGCLRSVGITWFCSV